MRRPRRPSRKQWKSKRPGLWFLLATGFTAVLVWFILPDFTWLNRPDTGLVITVARGEDQVRRFPVGVENPMWVRLADISPAVTAEVVAALDPRFFSHWGVDSPRLARRLLNRDSSTKELPATISMRLASTLYLKGRSHGLWRLLQVLMALKLDWTLSKRRILELYLNTVRWGEGIRGIGEASRRYYGDDPRFLSRAQSKVLAGILARDG